MKNIKTYGLIMIFLSSSFVSCFGKPKIEMKELQYDFENVKKNVELKHVFTFKNTGNTMLKIDKIKAG